MSAKQIAITPIIIPKPSFLPLIGSTSQRLKKVMDMGIAIPYMVIALMNICATIESKRAGAIR